MADVLHKTLPDSELHESKGVASAGPSTVYKANGQGSGNWVKIDATMLSGVNGVGAPGQALLLDGSGGFTTGASVAFLHGTAITTPQGSEAQETWTPLRPTNNWTVAMGHNIVVDDNKIKFGQAGLYQGTFTVSAFPPNGAFPDQVRSLLITDQNSTVIAAMANDAVSSTTVGACFRVPAQGFIFFQKVRTGIQYIPGILIQYAIHRIGD